MKNMAQKNARRSQAMRKEKMDRAYHKVAPGGKYQNPKRKGKRTSPIVPILIATLVVIAIIVGGIFLYSYDQTGVIARNVTVAGVNVGGMTQSQAISAVADATRNTYTKNTMTVTVLDSQIEIPPAMSKASLNVKDAVKEAYRHGKFGEAIDISPYLNLDEKAIKAALETLGEKYSSTLSQTKYQVNGTAPNQVLVITLGMPEYILDMNLLYRQVLDAYSANVFTTEGTCKLTAPAPLDLQAILTQYYVPPVDATFDRKTFEIIEGTDGYGFDPEKVSKTLEGAAYGSTVEIPFTSIPPAITSEALLKSLYKDTLSTYTATHESEPNRDINLRLACEAINGLIINPGETFSYNKALGERTAERGYMPGPSFENGKTVYTIGGGICQVSSALYNCVLTADLKIAARENHGYTVDYVRLGMDATVSWGTLDFCFTNNTNFPIRIEATAEGGTTVVTLVGTDEKDYYVEMTYEVLATYNYETRYKTFAPDNPEGYAHGDYIVEPHTGYSVRTYRCKFDKETKVLLSKEEEDASFYSKRDAVICVISGTEEDPSQGFGNGGVTDSGDALLP